MKLSIFQRRQIRQLTPTQSPSAARRTRERESPYDATWRRLRDKFYKKNPMCRFCDHDGIDRIGDDVDHIIPIAQGGERLDWSNLQTLCNKHHYGAKRKLERLALQFGQPETLILWCANPKVRREILDV